MRSLSYDELFIGGRWQAPSTSQRIEVVSPHTEEPIGETPEATPGDVDRAVMAARDAFDNGPWPRLSPSERIEKIEKLAAVYGSHMDEMANLITAEMGSPRSFSVRPATAGSEPKCLRQNHSLRTITGGAPGRSASSSEKVRPSVRET